jgi:arylsulfatase A-like enzyme
MGKTGSLLASLTSAVLLACGVMLVVGVEAEGQTKPNIVFVLTDDQFPGTQKTMSRLKNNVTGEGLKFTNTISTYPFCCPSRATIQRGQYAHNTRIYGNNSPDGGWPKFRKRGLHKSTVATWLNRAGYQTGLFGKYMNAYNDRLIPPGWDRWYAWVGRRNGGKSVNDQGTFERVSSKASDSLAREEALRFLKNRLDRRAPVFAFVNFRAMHAPYYHAKRDEDRFKGARVPRTIAFNEDNVSDKPAPLRRRPKLSRSKISNLDKAYRDGLRSLQRVDRFVGQASELLRREREMDDTYFVFYTDNGVHFGQHRLGHGKNRPYEEDVNFPLIIRGPGIPHGATSDKLVGNHDIAPTLARMGSARVPAFVDGRSFLGLAKKPSVAWPRTAILSERETNANAPNTWDMLRMEKRVYTRYEDGQEEYYDLKQDPYQVHNALGRSDTTYAAPADATLAYYEQRLDDLYRCGADGPITCKEAEDAPLLPPDTVP